MTHPVVHRINELGPELAATGEESERLGRLSDDAVRLMKDAGTMRLLQPIEHGGFAAHPRDFAEAVMATASWEPAAGWVAGVGGVHPWEMALMDPRLQEEVWGKDQDTWIASPYAPGGFAVPTPDGSGYVVNGRWPFSSGTDHCQWVFLGAMVGDPAGGMAQPPRALHIVLPRSDYRIDEDSWNVMGLRGTGSKDVVVEGAMVPAYRTISSAVMGGGADIREETLYRLPFYSAFPLGITAAVVGAAEGLFRVFLEQQSGRRTWSGQAYLDNPATTHPIGAAAAEIAASRALLVENISRIYDQVQAGDEVSLTDRAVARRNQVSCAWRAAKAAQDIFARAGGNAIRADNPLQRFVRDITTGLQHAIHAPGSVYAASTTLLGAGEPNPADTIMI